jgi:hypothetical protein
VSTLGEYDRDDIIFWYIDNISSGFAYESKQVKLKYSVTKVHQRWSPCGVVVKRDTT